MKIQWKDYLHGEHEELPWGWEDAIANIPAEEYDIDGYGPDSVFNALYEVGVNLETDTDTGETIVKSFELNGWTYLPGKSDY